MSLETAVSQVYSLDKPVYVRFLGRSDFSIAKYNSISLAGFSCFCSVPLKVGETFRVEVNLKMISGGALDDTEPHIATVELINQKTVKGKLINQFKFVDFQENCFDKLVKALVFLDKKEKIISIPVIPKDSIGVLTGRSIFDIVKDITEKTKNGQFVLPVLPKIVREVEIVVNNPDSTIDDLAMVIEKDAVISVKILSTANSPFYRGSSHIVSVRETIPRLGFKEIRNLVLTIANKSLYHSKNKLYKSLLEKLWTHSLTCAHCAKEIAREAGFNNVDNFYTKGLVHDVGKTMIFRMLSEMIPKDIVFSTPDIIASTEKYNHEMCDIILRHWGFADNFVNALNVHNSEKFDAAIRKSNHVIQVANTLARNLGYDLIGGAVDLSNLKSLKMLGLDINTLSKIGEHVRAMMEDSERAF